MITRRVKKAVTFFKQRQSRLEKDKKKQLEEIEKMYQHLEVKDAIAHPKHEPHHVWSIRQIVIFWTLGAVIAY